MGIDFHHGLPSPARPRAPVLAPDLSLLPPSELGLIPVLRNMTGDGSGWDIFVDRRSVSGLGNPFRVSGASWVLKVITANISRSSLYPLCPGPSGHLFGLEHTWVFFRPWLILRCPEVEGQKFNPVWLISWKAEGGQPQDPPTQAPSQQALLPGPQTSAEKRGGCEHFPLPMGARVSRLCLVLTGHCVPTCTSLSVPPRTCSGLVAVSSS